MVRSLLGVAAAGLVAAAVKAQPLAFDPAREQARQTAAVEALRTADERQAQADMARARAADAKPDEIEAARRAAQARAQTPEGRLEAQAEIDRDEAQPRVIVRAAATRRALAVQSDVTGSAQAARVGAAERAAQAEAGRTSDPVT